ncbi:hypothetical protein EGP44_11600, partial [Neisseria gonorrhoeae]
SGGRGKFLPFCLREGGVIQNYQAHQLMGGNENAVPYGQASHSERFRRHLYSLRVKPPSCKAVAKKPFILTGCRDERRRIL